MIHMIGNAHLDPVWLWEKREGFAEVVATMESALKRIEENGEFIFTCSSAAYYEFIKERRPQTFKQIQKAVKDGKWNIVGGWYVQPDNLIPSGEVYARHALYSQRFYKENFCVVSKTGYCVDSFGHNANLPQLLAKSGMQNYVFMRPELHENGDLPPLFWWNSIDGSKVLTYKISAGHYASYNEGMTEDKVKAIKEFSASGGYEHDTMCFYGVGNHGGGPTKKMLIKIDELKKSGEPVVFSCPDKYFDDVRAANPQIKEIVGDLHMHAIGCYSVASNIKAAERKAESMLLKAEKLNLMAHLLLGTKLESEAIQSAYKKVLFNSFHDIICGCCIKDGLDAAIAEYGSAISAAAEIIDSAVIDISKNIDTWVDGVGEVGKIQDFFVWEQEDYGVPIVVFNTQSYEVTKTVNVSHTFKSCLDGSGNSVPVQYVFDRYINGWDDHGTVFNATVPPFGYVTYWLYRKKDVPCTHKVADVKVNTRLMENDRITVILDEVSGAVKSIKNKLTGEEFLSGDSLVPYVINDYSDTWSHRVKTFAMNNRRNFKLEETSVVECGKVLGKIRFKYRLGESVCVQDLTLKNGEEVLCADVKVIYNEKNSVMRIPARVNGGKNFAGDIPYGYTAKSADGSENIVTRFASLTNDNGKGVALITENKPSFSATGDELAFIALRNSIYASHGSVEFKNSEYNYTDEGLHHFSYALYAFSNASVADIKKVADSIEKPEFLIDTYHKGELKRQKQFLSVTDGIIIEAVKAAEELSEIKEGSGIIIRAYETQNIARSAVLTFEGCDYRLSFAAGEVKTVKLANKKLTEVNFMEW